MKKLGFVLIVIGIGLFLAFIASRFFSKKSIISPVPDEQGIKVMYITPGAK